MNDDKAIHTNVVLQPMFISTIIKSIYHPRDLMCMMYVSKKVAKSFLMVNERFETIHSPKQLNALKRLFPRLSVITISSNFKRGVKETKFNDSYELKLQFPFKQKHYKLFEYCNYERIMISSCGVTIPFDYLKVLDITCYFVKEYSEKIFKSDRLRIINIRNVFMKDVTQLCQFIDMCDNKIINIYLYDISLKLNLLYFHNKSYTVHFIISSLKHPSLLNNDDVIYIPNSNDAINKTLPSKYYFSNQITIDVNSNITNDNRIQDIYSNLKCVQFIPSMTYLNNLCSITVVNVNINIKIIPSTVTIIILDNVVFQSPVNDFSSMQHLKTLLIKHSKGIVHMTLPLHLKELKLRNIPSLISLKGIHSITTLQTIQLDNLPKLNNNFIPKGVNVDDVYI